MNSITPDGLQMGKTLKLFWVPQDMQDKDKSSSAVSTDVLSLASYSFQWRHCSITGHDLLFSISLSQVCHLTSIPRSLSLSSIGQFPLLLFQVCFLTADSWFFQFQFWGNGHIKTSTSVLTRNGMEPKIKGANINITTFAFHLSLVSGLENGQEEHNLF